MTTIELLTYISLFSGGILVLLFLVSLLAGIEWDIEIGDGDMDGGGLGAVKGSLTFLSVGSWIVKVLLASETPMLLAVGAGVSAGIIAVFLLSYMLSALLKNQHNVNWLPDEAIGQTGKVYLRIPNDGSGIVQVKINGVIRELKAKTEEKKDIPTGADVLVSDYADGFAVVGALDDSRLSEDTI